MIFLIDTDVLIDIALDRKPHSKNSALFLDAVEKRLGNGVLAWHSVANFYYLVRPKHGNRETLEFLKELTKFVSVPSTGSKELKIAFSLTGLSDFEDALQVAAAIAARADYIVTRNIKHYQKSPIPAIEPTRALKMMSEKA